jgi:D-alanyl-D-alanine carboxypeptidase
MIRTTLRPFRAIVLVLAVAVVAGWLALPRPDATSPGVVPAANAAAPIGSATTSPSAGPNASPPAMPTGSAVTVESPAPPAAAASAQPALPISSVAPTGPPPAVAVRLHDSTDRRRLGTPSATPLVRAALDVSLERFRVKYGLPGVSAAILFADGSIWRGTAGLADVAAARKVTPDTAFSVASVSKTFTAALILGLVEDGRMRLDVSARTYLPTLPIDRAITVRQLLDHTSGLRDFYFGAGIDKALLSKPGRVWDPARSLTYIGKPFARPGTSWHYSNTNYLILGMLAEQVGGTPVATQLQERFFGPLGLDHTIYQSSMLPKGPTAHGYRFLGTNPKLPAIDLSDGTSVVPFTSVVTAAGGAGSIATTADDLVRWARALYAGDAIGPEMRAAMVADAPGTTRHAPRIPYGLGVQTVPVAGHPALGHSGRFLGARAVVRWLPGERIAIAVLTNQSRSDPNVVLEKLLTVALVPRSDCIRCPAGP